MWDQRADWACVRLIFAFFFYFSVCAPSRTVLNSRFVYYSPNNQKIIVIFSPNFRDWWIDGCSKSENVLACLFVEVGYSRGYLATRSGSSLLSYSSTHLSSNGLLLCLPFFCLFHFWFSFIIVIYLKTFVWSTCSDLAG